MPSEIEQKHTLQRLERTIDAAFKHIAEDLAEAYRAAGLDSNPEDDEDFPDLDDDATSACCGGTCRG